MTRDEIIAQSIIKFILPQLFCNKPAVNSYKPTKNTCKNITCLITIIELNYVTAPRPL